MTEFDTQSDFMMSDGDDLTQEQLEANFWQGLEEVMTGKTYPIEQLWNMVDDD